MTDYELDVAADHIVGWLKGEIAAGKAISIRATREYTANPVVRREEVGLSEDTDASSLMTIGVLEAWPTGVDEGWVLQLRVEDVVGPHTPDEVSVPDRPEEIDLDDFEAEFIAPDRGTVYVSVSAETAEAKRRFDRILADMTSDRYTGEQVEAKWR